MKHGIISLMFYEPLEFQQLIIKINMERDKHSDTQSRLMFGCGLPQKWYDRQKDSFKTMLWKNKELKFSYCGNTYNVVIDNVTIYMQGFAALPVLECITQKSEHVVLVDIGGETVDVIVCEGFHGICGK